MVIKKGVGMEVFCGGGTSEVVLRLLGTSSLEIVRDVSFVIDVLGVSFCMDGGGGEARMDERDVKGAVGVGEGT